MKGEKEKPIGPFSLKMLQRQKHRDTFFGIEEKELTKERDAIIRHIVMLDSIKVSQKDRDEMEERLYAAKREVERKIKNIYGQY